MKCNKFHEKGAEFKWITEEHYDVEQAKVIYQVLLYFVFKTKKWFDFYG